MDEEECSLVWEIGSTVNTAHSFLTKESPTPELKRMIKRSRIAPD